MRRNFWWHFDSEDDGTPILVKFETKVSVEEAAVRMSQRIGETVGYVAKLEANCAVFSNSGTPMQGRTYWGFACTRAKVEGAVREVMGD